MERYADRMLRRNLKVTLELVDNSTNTLKAVTGDDTKHTIPKDVVATVLQDNANTRSVTLVIL